MLTTLSDEVRPTWPWPGSRRPMRRLSTSREEPTFAETMAAIVEAEREPVSEDR